MIHWKGMDMMLSSVLIGTAHSYTGRVVDNDPTIVGQYNHHVTRDTLSSTVRSLNTLSSIEWKALMKCYKYLPSTNVLGLYCFIFVKNIDLQCNHVLEVCTLYHIFVNIGHANTQ